MNSKRSLTKLIRAFVFAATVSCSVCTTASGQVKSGSAADWLDARGVLETRLAPVSASWNEAALRVLLDQFAMRRKRPIFLDRRVDPTVLQSLVLNDQTTEQVVWKVAEKNGLGVSRVGELLYVGPKETAARLPNVIEELAKQLQKLPKELRSKWTRRSEVFWPQATTTKELQQWFIDQHGIVLDRSLPHDVWPAGDWPALSLNEQLSLLLAGFDCSFKVAEDGVSIGVIRMADPGRVDFRFRPPSKSFRIAEAKSVFPEIDFSGSTRSYRARGGAEQIAALDAWLVSRQRAETEDVVSRTYDLNTTARRGDILATISSQIGRKLEVEAEATEVLNGQVKLELSGASLEELLATCLEGTAFGFRVTDESLFIEKR